jgi:hypothetical protein
MLLALFFLILVVYVTYRFFLTQSATPKEANRLIPAFIVFGLLFVLVAIFSLSEWITALSPRNLPAITTRAELEQIELSLDDKKTPVLLIGASPSYTNLDTLTQFELADGMITITKHKNFAIIRSPFASAVLYGYLTPDGVEAVVIYIGSQGAYFSFLDRFAIIPILTTALSVIGAFITWAVPFIYARKMRHKIIS